MLGSCSAELLKTAEASHKAGAHAFVPENGCSIAGSVNRGCGSTELQYAAAPSARISVTPSVIEDSLSYCPNKISYRDLEARTLRGY